MNKKKLSLKQIGIDKLIIMLLAGVFLIILSIPESFTKDKKDKSNNNLTNINEELNEYSSYKYEDKLEEKLEKALEKIDGVGKTEVIITLKTSSEKVVLKDSQTSSENLNETDANGGNRISESTTNSEDTVIINNSEPYILKEIEPKIEGILIIAQKADNEQIIKEIENVAMVLFDVSKHKIKVMKMST